MRSEAWIGLLGADPRPRLLEADEPSARLITLTELLDRPADDPDVVVAHRQLLADPGTAELMARLPGWEVEQLISGHNSPRYAPNLLHLLADMGVAPGDDPRIERLLDDMLRHQGSDGRFAAFGRWRGVEEPVWASLLCDHHAIVEALVRFGRAADPRVRSAIARMREDLTTTRQGPGWPCLPDPAMRFRGPGRIEDLCPQVTLEALRTFARLPPRARPEGAADAAGTALQVWTARGGETPYMFGHGIRFKTVKWPTFWYDVYWVLDTLTRYPRLWRSPGAKRGERRAVAELAACLIAYNVAPDGTVTPRSCYRGFESFSFGQKKRPSPFATARVCAVLRRLDDLTDQIAAVDVLALGSSRAGTGIPLPPKLPRPSPSSSRSTPGRGASSAQGAAAR